MTDGSRQNAYVAEQLDQVADLLELLGKNPFRIRSYRRAAEVVRDSDRSMAAIVDESGRAGLEELPGIGTSLARSIEQIVQSGRLGLLNRLEGEASPEALLTRVPGIGPERASRIHDALGVETLEELEAAAHDGRLASVDGIGPTLVQGVQDVVAGLLGGPRRRQRSDEEEEEGARPSVELLLDADAEYRGKAEAGELRTIAPRRFNPDGEAWLPLMKAQRDGWSIRALFSNTKRAHDLGKTRDWVVMYYRKDGDEGQATVVTAGSGPLRGRRVVRGREQACQRYYREREG